MFRASAQIGEANSWMMHSGSGNSRFQSVMIGLRRLEEGSDRSIDKRSISEPMPAHSGAPLESNPEF